RSYRALPLFPTRRSSDLAHVEGEVRVVRELLDPGEAVLVGVEARLEHPQRERGQREHLLAPLDGLLLKALQRHDRVDQPHAERLDRKSTRLNSSHRTISY